MSTTLPRSAFPESFMDLQIRRLQRGDEAALSRFYGALPERSRFFFEPYRDTSEEAMAAVVDRSEGAVDLAFAAFHGDEILAHFFVMGVAEDVPHVGIGIAESGQGLGLGGVFLAYLLSVAKHGLARAAVGLTVIKENTRAVALYEKHGFRVVRDDVSFRTPNDSFEMRKVLNDA